MGPLLRPRRWCGDSARVGAPTRNSQVASLGRQHRTTLPRWGPEGRPLCDAELSFKILTKTPDFPINKLNEIPAKTPGYTPPGYCFAQNLGHQCLETQYFRSVIRLALTSQGVPRRLLQFLNAKPPMICKLFARDRRCPFSDATGLDGYWPTALKRQVGVLSDGLHYVPVCATPYHAVQNSCRPQRDRSVDLCQPPGQGWSERPCQSRTTPDRRRPNWPVASHLADRIFVVSHDDKP